MNFFKSVFSDDPDPPGTESESDSPRSNKEDENPEQSNLSEDDGSAWSFGGLMKTLATRSESVIETYRRDLEEFGSGLKKEIEVAQGSLGTVGHAIDEIGNTVLKGTAEIIAQGKEVILAAGNESDSSDNSSSKSFGRRDSINSKPYSRFHAQIRVVQGDVNTYCEEPEDLDDYKKWQSEFSLDEKAVDIAKMLEENGEMRGVYKKVVPNMVDQETFWFRYFFKVHKLKQAEDLRANLVKRAISLDDEEELSWDIDDDDDDDNDKNSKKVTEATKEASKLKLEGNNDTGRGDGSKSAKSEVRNADSVTEVSNVGSKTDIDSEEKKETDLKESETVLDVSDKVPLQDSGKSSPVPASHKAPPSQDSDKPVSVPASQEPVHSQDSSKPSSHEAAHSQDSGKPSSHEAVPSQDSSKPEDVSVSHKAVPSEESGKPEGASSSSSSASSTKQPLEEELGWDEIEDMSGIDNKEVVSLSSGSPNRAELRKRLSVAEEDEDLTWDIEDDEEEEASKSTKA